MATRYLINKREVTEEEFRKNGRGIVQGCPAATSSPTGWPLESDAAGVHPSQVADAMEHAASKGVPTEFNRKTGNPIFRSRKHRNAFLKAHGMRDCNAGYGDYAGR